MRRSHPMMIATSVIAILFMIVGCGTSQTAPKSSSAKAAAELTELYSGPGVMLRGPENCVGLGSADPWSDSAVLKFCAVKDVYGALGGPSSGSGPADFVESKNRFEFSQAADCDTASAKADGKHDNCAVTTGAVTLLRKGYPTRLFGVCRKPVPKDCAVLGTITDPNWAPDGVYLLMDPKAVEVRCQYAQDASRNGCNEDGFTAGENRQLCSADASSPMCEYMAGQQDQMLAAYQGYCATDALNCLENQLESRWGPESIVAVGYVNRRDQSNDCVNARKKAQKFTDAVNARWSTDLPLVQVFMDVSKDQIEFNDAAEGCEFVS